MNWRWLLKRAVIAIHGEQLSEHGGLVGLRDEGLLESALARPQNLAAYGSPSVGQLAAAYAYGLARNHPFIDGNKRTAFVTAVTFLLLNEECFEPSEAEATEVMLALAAGQINEKELAVWFEKNIKT